MKALIDIARKKQGSYSVAKVVWEITLNTKIIFFFLMVGLFRDFYMIKFVTNL